MSEIVEGKEYYWKSTESWSWFGANHWWDVFVVVTGYNGTGGACIEERWRWDHSNETIRREYRDLTMFETAVLFTTLEENLEFNRTHWICPGCDTHREWIPLSEYNDIFNKDLKPS